MKVSCRTCDSSFHVQDDSASELGASAFCPFCGTQISLQSSAPATMPAPPDFDPSPTPAKDAPSEQTTSAWNMTKEVLGKPVAVMAEADGDPAKLIPLGIPEDPSPPESEDSKSTVALQQADLPHMGRTEPFASPGGPSKIRKPGTEQLVALKLPLTKPTRPLRTPISVSTGQPGDTKPKRQVTGGVELPGLDQILEEAQLQDEADVEASAPAPAAISNFAPMDPQENILTALLLKPEVAEDPVDLDSMLEGDLVSTTPSQSSTAAPFLMPDPVVEIAADSRPLELSALDSGPLELLMLDSEPTSSQSGNEVVEIALEASGDDPAPMAAASLPLGVDLWLVEDEDSAGETKADILRRIRAGELGPRDRVSPADPDDDRSWELAELPEFKRYVMLFGRTGAKVRSARGAFWERFRRS